MNHARHIFAEYSQAVKQSIPGRPNLHVKNEHLANILRILVSHIRYVYRTIAEYLLAVREIVCGSAFFFCEGLFHVFPLTNDVFSGEQEKESIIRVRMG